MKTRTRKNRAALSRFLDDLTKQRKLAEKPLMDALKKLAISTSDRGLCQALVLLEKTIEVCPLLRTRFRETGNFELFAGNDPAITIYRNAVSQFLRKQNSPGSPSPRIEIANLIFDVAELAARLRKELLSLTAQNEVRCSPKQPKRLAA